jgi:hypothetical protein
MGDLGGGSVREMDFKRDIKKVLGMLPLAAEIVQTIRPLTTEFPNGFRLDRLESVLSEWIPVTERAVKVADPLKPKRVLLVASLRWWMEYCIAVGLLLRGLGHKVDIAYVPYKTWDSPAEEFDVRRHRLYLRNTLARLGNLLGFHDISKSPDWSVSSSFRKAVEEQTHIDVQYTLQRESLTLDKEGVDLDLYRLRKKRNSIAANAAVNLLSGDQYDVLIIPNGSILEFGIFYRVATKLNIPLVTIEFGEQRERMWLAQNDEVMRLDTSALWNAKKPYALTDAELDDLKTLYEARRGGRLWENFSRQWQAGESKGAQEVRSQLNLDPNKPLALLCTNVVGDSLALGRQIFTAGMADWLAKTVRHFAQRPDYQIVVRVHPGELLGAGHPSVDIVQSTLPDLPPHVVVIPPDSKVNTYDLIELAHLGLVYTTTVGMEMAMSGVPVIVSGMTHYRDKGFTYDPQTTSEYLSTVDQLMRRPIGEKISQEKVQLAWNYAYRFFFDFPFPFPWHLITFWEDIEARPLQLVFQESLHDYAPTLDALLGKPMS